MALTFLRELANAEAQTALHEYATDLAIRHREDPLATGDHQLGARYSAAEAIVRAIDAAIESEQAHDPDAPTYLSTRCCGADIATPHWGACVERLDVNDPASYRDEPILAVQVSGRESDKLVEYWNRGCA
jgi:hypothetical protein